MKKRIGLGTWSWGNQVFWDYQISNDNDLRETYKEALKRGFNLIDSADSYGTGKLNGRSEELLGQFLLDTPTFLKKRISLMCFLRCFVLNLISFYSTSELPCPGSDISCTKRLNLTVLQHKKASIL